MKNVELIGEIGWDVLAENIELPADDVKLIIDSPGGNVFDAVSIYNIIRNHIRQGFSVTGYIRGIALSAASYIAMACNKLVVEDNSVFMIHNPWMLTFGDYEEMEKSSKFLVLMRDMLVNAYKEKTGKEEEEIKSLMKNETWLYGSGIVEAGFSDEMELAAEGPEDDETAVKMANEKFENLKAKSNENKKFKDQIGIAAAVFDIIKMQKDFIIVSNGAVSVDMNKEKPRNNNAGENSEVVSMETIKSVEAESHETENHDKIFDDGVKAERKRVQELRNYITMNPENEKLREVIAEAEISGASCSDPETNAKIVQAMIDGMKAGENPPAVETEEPINAVEDDTEKYSKIAAEIKW